MNRAPRSLDWAVVMYGLIFSFLSVVVTLFIYASDHQKPGKHRKQPSTRGTNLFLPTSDPGNWDVEVIDPEKPPLPIPLK